MGNDVIFLDGFDIKRISGIEQYGDVEYTSIIPHFRDYLQSVADKDYLQYTQFFHYKKEQQVWVSIPTGATTHYCFILDYRFLRETGRWSVFPLSGLSINCFGGVEDGEVVDIHYGDETGYAHKLDDGFDDGGSAVEKFATFIISGTSPESPNLHINRKQFLHSESFVKPETAALTMTPYYALDLEDSAQVRTSGNYTALTEETVSGWDGTG